MATQVLGGMNAVRVAVAQVAPRFLDPAITVERAVETIRSAARDGAQLVVFPETYLAGYPYWTEGWDSEVSGWRRARLGFREAALETESDELRTLCETAREAGVFVVMGFNEMDAHPAIQTIYNSCAFIDNEGRLLGVRRKLMPTFTERLFWGRGDGSGLTVFQTEIGRIGGLICGENTMTLARAALIAQGEDIHIMQFPGAFSLTRGPRLEESDEEDGSFWGHASARVHAKEAGCFVISACGLIEADDIPSDFPYRDRMNIDYAVGGSCLVGPSGLPIVGPEYGAKVIHGTFEAERIKLGKAISDTMGHYARPDVLRLLVNDGDSWVRADQLAGFREQAKRSAESWGVDEAAVAEAAEDALEG